MQYYISAQTLNFDKFDIKGYNKQFSNKDASNGKFYPLIETYKKYRSF